MHLLACWPNSLSSLSADAPAGQRVSSADQLMHLMAKEPHQLIRTLGAVAEALPFELSLKIEYARQSKTKSIEFKGPTESRRLKERVSMFSKLQSHLINLFDQQ